MPGYHIGERRRVAAIAHIGHFQASTMEKERHAEMRDAANASFGIGEFSWLRAHVGDELGDRFGREILVHHQDERVAGNDADGREVLDWVVAELCERRIDGEGRCGAPRSV